VKREPTPARPPILPMAESLLLPVVSGLVGKASNELVQSITRMWGIDNNRSRLERSLVYVQSLLADAEVKSETNPAVRTCMKALKAVAYKADDVLDGFQYEALRREAQSNRSIASKILSNFTSNNRLVMRYKASRDLKDVLDKIEVLVSEMNEFGLVERAEVPQVLYRQTHSALDESEEIHGRDDDKAAVVKLLLDQPDQKNVQVLPIIGMGGLGKTTLAKMVYNDHRVQKHFELNMWHCVSENFEATHIVRSVIELTTNGRCDLPDNIELLRRKLQEAIGRKKFLLVLDDVWNEEQHKWEVDLKPLLCSSLGGSGSMIVITSRSRQVASIMGTCAPYEPVCLNEDDAWELFSKKAFSKGVEKREELVVIGRRIVNKCKGLPLALKTMGGLMSSKQEAQEWEAVADCNISDTSRGRDEVMSILKLSYRHLSPEMKQCFAFCAVFPKDYEMEKGMLIQLWMANGYIHEEGTMSLAQKAEFIFNELTWRSFLQNNILLRTLNVSYIYASKQELNVCKMHDLMHDLAKHVSNECATVDELVQGKVPINGICHLQISWHDQLDNIAGLFKGTICLRTLLKLPSSKSILTEAKLMASRALSFRSAGISIVRRQLIHTSHLRYLDLSDSLFISLPDSICILYNLQSLRLNGCEQLRHLPEGMGSMRKLSHIYLFRCRSLERMPPKLSLLCNLHTLTTFVVDTEEGRGIEELKNLQHLGNRMELFNLRKVKYGSKANLHEKHNLTELLLYWGHLKNRYEKQEQPTVDEGSNAEHVLESLVPHSKLKTLEVCGYGGLTVAHWMRQPQMFQCLRELIMIDCPRCKDLPIVWLSSSLEHLSLWRMESLTTLCKNIDVEPAVDSTSLQIFPKLKAMELLDLPELERWVENSAGEINSLVIFPQLEALTIRRCCKLEILLESPSLTDLCVNCCSDNTAEPIPHRCMSASLGFLPSLVSLEINSRLGVVMPLDGEQSQRPLDTLRKLRLMGDGMLSILNESKLGLGLRDYLSFVEKLDIYCCSNIVQWPLEDLRCLPRLRSLSISSCDKLERVGSSFEEEQILPLPMLEMLSIDGCDMLLAIPPVPASLEKMDIQFCTSLVALPSNLGNLANIRDLKVCYCDGLEVLPDGMEGGLTSLEELKIIGCPGIEEFPQGLLQRLPSLTSLEILRNPELQRRCREGGEYFALVSSIPKIDIGHLPVEDREKPAKRLLPWCGGGSGPRCVSYCITCLVYSSFTLYLYTVQYI
jgi:hypothetical protein